MTNVSRPVLRWHGGKWILAPWIIRHFPDHLVYTETFGGAASVLMRKPRSYSEVYNDLDHDVVNLFRVLRNKELAVELRDKLRMTPFARNEFEDAYIPSHDPVEKARHLIIRSFMGFGSNAHNDANCSGFRANSKRSGTTPAHDWKNYADCLDGIIERVRGIVIENRPAIEIILQHDSNETLHYVDPPYVHSTRGAGGRQRDYRHELTDDDHRKLSAVLKYVSGAVILSGYPCKLYDEELYADWDRVERRALADGARERTEVLWMNKKACQQGKLF